MKIKDEKKVKYRRKGRETRVKRENDESEGGGKAIRME